MAATSAASYCSTAQLGRDGPDRGLLPQPVGDVYPLVLAEMTGVATDLDKPRRRRPGRDRRRVLRPRSLHPAFGPSVTPLPAGSWGYIPTI
ncbi:hypothetical protein, partial [Streptomyces scabiei]|uniref:hypothetical protein n=1 Tax=Streptomyces scabiei TaxID=1930 RepID=UPI003908195A